MQSLREVIENGFQSSESKDSSLHQAVNQVINLLDCGELRVAEKVGDEWRVNDWIKKAILLYFRFSQMQEISVGPFVFHDKIPLKGNFVQHGVRVVPPAVARFGCYLEKGVILMPSYVNIGAYVGARTMVDNWALVGSCAQIGADVHLSASVVIGGVLEPPQAQPVIIEDGAFIGAGANLVEGILVEQEAVIGANVTLTGSTKIIDVSGPTPVEYRGRVPARSVVIPGSITKEYPAGTFNVNCALIVGKRSASTDKKTSLNEVLREFF